MTVAGQMGRTMLLTVFRLGGLSEDLLAGLNHVLRPLPVAGAESILVKRARTLAAGVCVEYAIELPPAIDVSLLSRDLDRLADNTGTDIFLQDGDSYGLKKLVVFDMDSTLIEQEVIDELAREADALDQTAAITERAMQGSLDFAESLRARVSLLAGLDVQASERVRERITFAPGVRIVCAVLRKLGIKIAVLSGGFVPFVQYAKDELNLDYAFANSLQVSPDGKYLTGRVEGRIVDAAYKAELLEQIASENMIDLKDTIAVGDGANDLLMLAKAGLSVAYRAKPRVQAQASTTAHLSRLTD